MTSFQTSGTNGKTVCQICPRQCALGDGDRGFCHIRQNQGGTILCTNYGYTTGLAVDPIEKKPLYHFLPGSQVLSFGTLGCNMGCLFCQNWSISKSKADIGGLTRVEPGAIPRIAQQYGCKSVAFTYNEPTVFYEYALDTAKECQTLGIKTVAVSAGYINPEPRAEFFKYVNAVNIDLKAFSDEFYRRNCQAQLAPVLDTIQYIAKETNVWLELTTLLIEGENDSNEELQQECDWIARQVGTNVPLHFSAFHPAWKFQDRARTSLATLLRARNIAQAAGLKYVYTGNLSHAESSTTFCEFCGAPIVTRQGFQILENRIAQGKCPQCGGNPAGKFLA